MAEAEIALASGIPDVAQTVEAGDAFAGRNGSMAVANAISCGQVKIG